MKHPSFPPFIVGAMRLGSWGAQLSTSQLEGFIRQCLDLGLSHFDHADIYGDYTTEEEFGKVLREHSDLRSQLQLTTKCGIKMMSKNRPAHQIKSYDSGSDHIIASVENSLRNLATDYLDILLIHRPDYLMNPEEIAAAFETLKKAGKVLYFGVSNFTTAQFDLLNSYTPLVTNQMEISLMHLDAFEDGTLLQCQQHRITPTAWSPLGGGQLFKESDKPQVNRIQKAAVELCEKHSCTLDQLLLAWLMKHPADIVPVLGTSKIERVQLAMDATMLQLSKEDWYLLWQASTGHEVA